MLDPKTHRLMRLSPLLFIFSILPLLVYYIPFKMPSIFEDLYMADRYSSTFFFIKVLAYILITVYMILLLVILRKQFILHRTPTFNICYLMSGVFIMFTLLSSYFSPFQEATLLGAPSRLEGTLVIICYFLTFIVGYVSIQSAHDMMPIFYTFMVLSILQVFVGATQFIGYDILSWGSIRQFTSSTFTADHYYSTTPLPFFLPTSPKSWTGTIGNSNYSGSFVALGLPLFTILYFCLTNRSGKILCLLAALAHLTISFLCGSRAGMVGIGLSLILLIIVTYASIPKALTYFRDCFRKKTIKSTFATGSLCIYILFLANISGTFNDLSRLFNDVKQVVNVPTATKPSTSEQLVGFNFMPYTLILESADTSLTITINQDDASDLHFISTETAPIQFVYETPGNYRILSGNFKNYILKVNNVTDFSYITIDLGRGDSFESYKSLCSFHMDEQGNIQLINPYSQAPIQLLDVPSIGFQSLERIGSGRGYIWSRSLPLLSETLLVGYGADAYILAYPQDDFFGKLSFLSNPWIVVDKPHNTYLQFWINHGFIAFLAFLILNTAYISQSLRLFGFKEYYTHHEGIGLAIMLAIVAYLGASFFNDTTISVTPMYFALLGMGLAYNRIYKSLQLH